MEIYEDGIKIGTLQIEEDGLYTVFTCKCEVSDKIRRVYVAYPYGAKYLGIPNRDGYFKTRIAQKNLPEQYHVTATTQQMQQWLPWRGEVDGVMIDAAWICESGIAMPLSEAMKFPEWEMDTIEINQIEMALLPLNADGVPLPKEREAVENETFDFDDIAVGDFADQLSDDSIGGEGWEADRSDL